MSTEIRTVTGANGLRYRGPLCNPSVKKPWRVEYCLGKRSWRIAEKFAELAECTAYLDRIEAAAKDPANG